MNDDDWMRLWEEDLDEQVRDRLNRFRKMPRSQISEDFYEFINDPRLEKLAIQEVMRVKNVEQAITRAAALLRKLDGLGERVRGENQHRRQREESPPADEL
jgi:hypothetical protein